MVERIVPANPAQGVSEQLTPEQVADHIGVTPYSDMRSFVVQAVKYAREQDAAIAVADAPRFVYSSVTPVFKDNDSDEIDHLECWLHTTIKGDDQSALYERAKAITSLINAALTHPAPSGQAVGEEDALETIERELIDGLEVEINIGAENYTFNHRQLARRILSALSQPHPADERVVEALREARRGLNMVHDGLMDPTRPRQSVGEVAAYWLEQTDAALAALTTEGRKNG